MDRDKREGKQKGEVKGQLIPVQTCFSFQGACSLIVVLRGLLPLPGSFNVSSCEPTTNQTAGNKHQTCVSRAVCNHSYNASLLINGFVVQEGTLTAFAILSPSTAAVHSIASPLYREKTSLKHKPRYTQLTPDSLLRRRKKDWADIFTCSVVRNT